MKTIITCLLAQRNDGKFLKLNCDEPQYTTYEFVVEPELAERIIPWDSSEFKTPKKPPYYFENSRRARELWLKDCVMVAYEITTEVLAKKLIFL